MNLSESGRQRAVAPDKNPAPTADAARAGTVREETRVRRVRRHRESLPAPDDGREPSVGDIARFRVQILGWFCRFVPNHAENTDVAFIAL